MEKVSSRLKVLAVLVALMFVALSTRLWFLQVLATTQFQQDARANSVRFVYTPPLRGQVFDDEGKLLVGNQASLEVRVDRAAMGDQAEAVVARLAKLLHVDVRRLVASLQDKRYYPFQPIPVAEFVPKRAVFYISEHQDLFPGVEVVQTAVRQYPDGRMAAHVLGYVGLINAQEYDQLKTKGYQQSDVIGRAGIEQIYEKFLRGQQGEQKFIVNSDGETIRALASIVPTPGDDLHLTLDSKIQRIAENQLSAGLLHARTLTDSSGNPLRANAGAVVVLDAKTGAVRAMASLPSYDPRWLVRGLTKSEAKYLYKSPTAPALNRAMQLSYIPGSTFKPITGLAALKEGIATMSGSYPCTTSYTHPGDTSGAIFHNWAPSNTYMSLFDAIRESCDTVFYGFGSQFYFHYVNDQLGSAGQLLQADLRQFGFGGPTGVDLPSEAAGLVPDAAWAKTRPDLFPDGWVPGGDILTMIGSTYITASPLQLAQAYGAVANGGHLCRPHVVDRVIAPNGNVVKRPDARCDRRLPYSSGQLDYIRTALRSVVSSGTAACAFSGFPLSQIAVGGKTGTAERPPYQDTSWFAATAGPDPNSPRYIVITMVEQGGFGAETAAPITRHVIEDIYGIPEGQSGCTSSQVATR
jgi:penicillin-binding protein 2